jgi:hypothetical protein
VNLFGRFSGRFLGQPFFPGIEKAVDFAYQIKEAFGILLDGGLCA